MKFRLPDIPTKRLVVLVLGELALVSLFAVILSAPRLGVKNFRRIKHGMSFPEVVAILGEPHYGSITCHDLRLAMSEEYSGVKWKTRDAEVEVAFDSSGKVCWADRWAINPEKSDFEKLFDRFKQWWNQLLR